MRMDQCNKGVHTAGMLNQSGVDIQMQRSRVAIARLCQRYRIRL